MELSREGGLYKADSALIKEAISSGSKARAGLIVVENDEVIIFEVAAHGIRDVSHFSLRGGGKRTGDSTLVRKEFFERVARRLRWFFRIKCRLLSAVLISKGGLRIQSQGLGARNSIVNAPTSIGGRAAANEVLAEGWQTHYWRARPCGTGQNDRGRSEKNIHRWGGNLGIEGIGNAADQGTRHW